MSAGHNERMRRWRLVLGAADGTGVPLAGDDARIDAALGALYDSDEGAGLPPAAQRQAGLGRPPPAWLAGSATSVCSSRSAWCR